MDEEDGPPPGGHGPPGGDAGDDTPQQAAQDPLDAYMEQLLAEAPAEVAAQQPPTAPGARSAPPARATPPTMHGRRSPRAVVAMLRGVAASSEADIVAHVLAHRGSLGPLFPDPRPRIEGTSPACGGDGDGDRLAALLAAKPARFLERCGKVLGPSHLAYFARLEDAAGELEALLGSLAGPACLPGDQLRARRHVAVKNRRFAQLRRLEAEGSYFGDEAMRERDPALFEAFIGRFAPRATSALAVGSGSAGAAASTAAAPSEGAQSMKLSEALLHIHHMGCGEGPSPGGGSAPEPWGAPPKARDPAEPGRRSLWGAMDDEKGAASHGRAAGSGMAAAAAGALPAAPEGRATAPFGSGVLPVPLSAAAVAEGGLPSPEERQLLRDEFVRVMKQRFLDGHDGTFVDYAAIDRDESLDAAMPEARQDMEDAYFDDL